MTPPSLKQAHLALKPENLKGEASREWILSIIFFVSVLLDEAVDWRLSEDGGSLRTLVEVGTKGCCLKMMLMNRRA